MYYKKKDSFFLLILYAVLLYMAFSVHLPIRDYPALDLGWITALTLASIKKTPWITGSISLGFLMAAFFPINNPVIIQDSNSKLLSNLITLLCIVLSVVVFQRIGSFRNKACWLGMCSILMCMVWFSLQQEQKNIAAVYLSAAIITGILLCLKNRTLSFLPYRMFFAWLAGYLPWFLISSLPDFNPIGTFRQDTIILTYLLIPFPVYTLQILIGSHISDAIQNKDASIFNS